MKFLVSAVFLACILFTVNIAADDDLDKNKCPPCPQPYINDPQCGDDGHTYSSTYDVKCANKCRGDKNKVKIQYRGRCVIDDVAKCVCPAPLMIDYQCGDDGRSYVHRALIPCINKCLKTNVKIAHSGRCEAPKEDESEDVPADVPEDEAKRESSKESKEEE